MGLLAQSIPVIVDLASQVVLWTLEIMLVGRLGAAPGLSAALRATREGAQAIVAVGAAQLVLLITVTVLLTFVMGAVVSINRLLGARRVEEADHFLGQSALWALLVSIPVGLLLFLAAEPLARLLIGVESLAARQMMSLYLRTLAPFAPLFVLNFVLMGVLRGVGDSKLSMSVNLMVNGLHFAGALGLVFGLAGLPALGVQGSALAGGVAHSLGCLLSVGLLAGGRSRLRLRRRDLVRMVPGTARRLFKLGLPMTVEQFSWGLGMLLLLGVATRLGTSSGAAHIALLTLQRVASLVYTGLGIAVLTTVGRHVGAECEDLVRAAYRRMLVLGLAAATLMAGVVLWIPGPIVRLFSADPGVVAVGGELLMILAFLQPPKVLSYLSSYGLRGRGDTRFPMLAIVAGVLVLELGLGSALALPLGLGVGGIWMAHVIDECLRATLVTRRFFRRRVRTASPPSAQAAAAGAGASRCGPIRG